jgi:nitroimidazol reductase NimA-like FMN-containing flavoprotein (pyridoxamine 5'-phosphate oxidase superfamily)
MPRDLEELSSTECWELLAGQQVGRLGFVANGQPIILPVNYVVDAGTLLFRTEEGGKLDAAIRGQRVAFEVDVLHTRDASGWSVLLKGLADRLEDPAEVERASKLELHPWAAGEKPYFVRITPSSTSGRRIPAGHYNFDQIHEVLMYTVTDEEEITRLRETLPTP